MILTILVVEIFKINMSSITNRIGFDDLIELSLRQSCHLDVRFNNEVKRVSEQYLEISLDP